jgi:hypothetical protein
VTVAFLPLLLDNGYINWTKGNKMDTSIHNIKEVYSGKPGCMCGCRGKYSTEGRGVKIIYNKVMKSPFVKLDEGAKCAYIDDRNASRNLVVYFKD